MTTECMLTLPWSEEKQKKLDKDGYFFSEPFNLFRKTHTGDKEHLQFKVEIVKMPTINIAYVRYAMLLHCLKGQNVTVLWSYHDKSHREPSVVDKVVFPVPGIVYAGDAKRPKRLLYGGALHKEAGGSIYDMNNLEVHVKVEEQEESIDKKKNVSIQDDIVKDLNNLFNSSDTADVHLVCKGMKFPCHRLLLAARSSVFKTMFFSQVDYKESEEGQVTMDEFEPNEVKQFLRFIYCGECDFKDVDPWHILALADMYDVQMLNKICCQCQVLVINFFLQLSMYLLVSLMYVL